MASPRWMSHRAVRVATAIQAVRELSARAIRVAAWAGIHACMCLAETAFAFPRHAGCVDAVSGVHATRAARARFSTSRRVATMSSILHRGVSRTGWLLVFYGVISILFGISALLWPGSTVIA